MSIEIQPDHGQLNQFQEALKTALSSRNELEQMLFFHTGGRKLSLLAPENANLTETIFKVIMQALKDNWLSELVKGAHDYKPQDPVVRQFVAANFPDFLIALPGNCNAVIDPLDAYFLSEDRGRAFIGRRQLREGLRVLTGAGLTPKILAVHSDLSLCGKTYTADFIRFYAMHTQQRVAYVDLCDNIALGDGLNELVEELGRQLRVDVNTIPEPEAQPEHWIRELTRWLVDQVRTTGEFWWFIFDSINQVDSLPKEVTEFVARLAKQLEQVEHDPPCRLILISYQGREQLPLDLQQRVVQDVIREPIGLHHLREFFEERARHLLEGNGVEAQVTEAAETLSQWALERLNAVPEGKRPFAISTIVRDAMITLETSLVDEEVSV